MCYAVFEDELALRRFFLVLIFIFFLGRLIVGAFLLPLLWTGGGRGPLGGWALSWTYGWRGPFRSWAFGWTRGGRGAIWNRTLGWTYRWAFGWTRRGLLNWTRGGRGALRSRTLRRTRRGHGRRCRLFIWTCRWTIIAIRRLYSVGAAVSRTIFWLRGIRLRDRPISRSVPWLGSIRRRHRPIIGTIARLHRVWLYYRTITGTVTRLHWIRRRSRPIIRTISGLRGIGRGDRPVLRLGSIRRHWLIWLWLARPVGRNRVRGDTRTIRRVGVLRLACWWLAGTIANVALSRLLGISGLHTWLLTVWRRLTGTVGLPCYRRRRLFSRRSNSYGSLPLRLRRLNLAYLSDRQRSAAIAFYGFLAFFKGRRWGWWRSLGNDGARL